MPAVRPSRPGHIKIRKGQPRSRILLYVYVGSIDQMLCWHTMTFTTLRTNQQPCAWMAKVISIEQGEWDFFLSLLNDLEESTVKYWLNWPFGWGRNPFQGLCRESNGCDWCVKLVAYTAACTYVQYARASPPPCPPKIQRSFFINIHILMFARFTVGPSLAVVSRCVTISAMRRTSPEFANGNLLKF